MILKRDKHGDKEEDNSPKNVNNTSSEKYTVYYWNRKLDAVWKFIFLVFICVLYYILIVLSLILTCIILHNVPDIGLAVRVFANGPGDLGSIPGRVIPKIQKMVLDASLLNTQHYKVWIKGKVEPSREGVAPSPTSWCSSYRKGSLRVTLDYGRQLYFYFTYYPSYEF